MHQAFGWFSKVIEVCSAYICSGETDLRDVKMKPYLILGMLVLMACDEVGGVSYTAPYGYTLVTDPDQSPHQWMRIEGNRAFFRQKSSYSGYDLGTYYVDYNCKNQTYRVDGGDKGHLRDLAPDSIGRAAYWDVCRGSI